MAKTIGVLALQGGVREHADMLTDLGCEVVLVKKAAQLSGLDGIVLPGGESSTMDRILRRFGMREQLASCLQDGLPVLGTCAGLIMLAHHLEDPAPGQQTLDVLDIDVRRNAFGPQRDSAVERIETTFGVVEAAFIRAPEVIRAGEGVEVIARVDGRIVGVRTPHAIGISFHPELTGDSTIHQQFLVML